MLNLAYDYRNGVGVVEEELLMIYWYIRCAIEGNTDALQYVGSCLSKGMGLRGMEDVGHQILVLSMGPMDGEVQEMFKNMLQTLLDSFEHFIFNRKK